jgi:lipopolysaccharide export system permease protein
LAWIASPFLAFAVGIAMILLWFSASIIPLAADKAEDIRVTKIEKRPPATTLTIQQPWISVGPQTLMNVTSGAVGGSTIGGIRLFHFERGFQLVDLTDAEEAHYANEGWTLYRGRHRHFLPDGSVSVVLFDQQPIALSLIPEDFTSRFGNESETMTLHDIRAFTSRLSHEGAQLSRLLTDYYGRIAFPFVTIVMVLVGIAMSLRRSGARGGGIAIGIGQALAVGFCYWATHSIAIALGRGGALEPMMAGWTANLLFMSFALYLMLKVRY